MAANLEDQLIDKVRVLPPDTLYFVALFNPRDRWQKNLKIDSPPTIFAQSSRLSP